MAWLHDGLRRHRLAGGRAAGKAHHPQTRLAHHVRPRRARRARRLVFAEKIAGIAALAGIRRTHRRGRDLAPVDRTRSFAATFPAARAQAFDPRKTFTESFFAL